jgi:hypothetical protein
MLSTRAPSSVTSTLAPSATALAPAPLPGPAAPEAPPRVRFRRLVVFDGRLA